MTDNILKNFLIAQHSEVMSLAAASDILQIESEPVFPPQRYVVRFNCRGLVRTPAGEIAEAEQFDVGIWLPDDYLRFAEASQVVSIFKPQGIWHPNAGGPFMCLGHLTGGTPLVDIVYQIYEIITYHKWAAHDGLNPAACEWARNNQQRFPVDRRPLKWKGGTP